MNPILALGRRVGFFAGGLLLLALCSIAASNAQSSKPGFWDVEKGADSTSSALRLFKYGESNTIIDTIPISRFRLLRDVKRRIEKEAGFTAVFALTDMAMPNANAFSTSSEKGNFVAVNLAMLNLLGDDADALAAVVGHEYAHIALNHRDARTQREGVRQGISAVLGFLLGRAGVPMAGTLSDLGTTMFSRTFSRDEERDADAKGIAYAAAAGFSVEGGIRAWERMSRSNTSLSIPFLATHPASDERIETMRKMALNYPQRADQMVAAGESAQPQPTIGKLNVANDPDSIVKPENKQDQIPTCSGYNTSVWNYCVGSARWGNGGSYSGEWRVGLPNGRGTMTNSVGAQVSGIWDNGVLVRRQSVESLTEPIQRKLPPCAGAFDVSPWTNCFGEFTFSNGNRYVGEWKDGKYSGRGTEYRSDGSLLRSGIWEDGEFVRGSDAEPLAAEKAQAEKIATEKAEAERLAAERAAAERQAAEKANQSMLSHLPPCQGSFSFSVIWTNCVGTAPFRGPGGVGGTYFGEFRANNPYGQGTVSWRDGRKYVGEFRDSTFNGRGSEFRADGSVLRSGIWEAGTFVGSQ